MDETAILLGIEAMRSDPVYHAAEVLRRSVKGGAAAMAAFPKDSAERNAVFLLISNWEVFAVLILGSKGRDKIFEVTPVCHMYTELDPAIQHLQEEIPGLATNFKKMNDEYQAWLKKKKKHAKYVTAACDGLMHAKFG
jgi:tripartite-type tricarboxylate transporter receptor subunit TctC